MKYKDFIINMKKQVTLIAMFLYSVLAWGQTIVGSGDGWSLDSEGVLTVTKDLSYSLSSQYPWYASRESVKSVVLGDDVMSIGTNAFSGCKNINELHLGSIESYCNISFGNSSSSPLYSTTGEVKLYVGAEEVTSIVIPEGVTAINNYAFKNCSGLTSVTIPESVTSIGGSAFYNCSGLTSVTIPESVTSIGGSAFCNCSGLTSVTIPKSITSIGGAAFSGCKNINELHLGSIESYCNISLGSNSSPLYSTTGEVKLYVGAEEVTSIVIPEGVTAINNFAFKNCSGLTSVTIPESVTSIGDHAFYNCSGLTSVTIPEGVESIGNYTFWGCSGLTSVTIPEGVESIGNYTFYGCSGLTSVTIPESVTSIGGSAFYNCSGLTSVTIPEGVESIGNYAFYNCSGLTSVTIPEGVESIGNYTFWGCSGLTSVTIPESVTSIGDHAFYNCSGLTSVTIPESVTSIGGSAFYNCSGLTSVTIPESVTSIGEHAFEECKNIEELHISSVESWCKTQFSNYVFMGASTKVILYDKNGKVTDLVIPQGIEEINDYAFRGCSGLTSVTIPEGVTRIGTHAFYACSSTTSITIPSSVTSIGYRAFDNCSNLTSVSILSTNNVNYEINNNSETYITIGSYEEFAGCENLKYVFLHQNSVVDNLTEIFPTYKTIERFFVPDNILSNYRETYGTDENLKDKFTGFSMITKQEAAGGEEETVALSLEKGSYNFITWAVNSGEQVRNGEEISIALTEDFDLVADDVTWQTLGTAEHPFKGIFEGNGHSIIFGGDAANSDNTLFGHIDEGAEIRNLNVENMNVMAGDDNKVVDGEYTYYPILAKENRGTIKKCVVSGSVMCDEEIENDEKSIGCFIVDNYGTLDHVVEFYKYGIEAEGNKRNIVIMQNMGVGRYAGQTRKVCNNRKKKNKSLSATPSSDVNDDYREYTDEEMASGEPAYWLNYAGKGYTGDYTSEWSKGKMHPIMATELSKPAVKVVYEIEGASESYAGLKDPVFFANEDDEIEIETAVAPEKVWLGNNVAEELNSRTKLTKKLLSSAAKDGIITVHLMYSKATGIESAKAEKSIRVNGHAISIEGAEGESYSVVDVMGRTVAEGEANGEKTIVVPAAGIYVVKAGDRAQKIVVK